RDVWRTPHGKKYLADITGQASAGKNGPPRVLLPEHPWLKHLDAKAGPVWLEKMQKQADWAVAANQGERILGTPEGSTLLYRQRAGQGHLIYLGGDLSDALPAVKGAVPPVAAEQMYAEQMSILSALVADLYADRK